MSVRKRVKRNVERTQAPSGGESGSEWLERGDHPLLNDVILEILLGFVRRCDLKVCRVVSKKWNLRTIPHMRATFTVKIHESESYSSSSSNRRIDEFVKLFSSNVLGIPYGKFRLGTFSTTDGVGQRFLQLCGELATEVDLNGETFTIEDTSELLAACPNLKVFLSPSWVTSRSGNIIKLFPDATPTFSDLKDITFCLGNNGRLSFCPTFIEELMAAAPNINITVLGALEYNKNEDASAASDVLNVIEKLGKESSIQSLDLSYARIRDIEQLERMAKKGLKLKSLCFKPREATDDEFDRVQIRLATIFKDSLQSLHHLDVDDFVENILMEFPKMPNLKSLRLLRFLVNSSPKPVNLNDNFPALETLDIGIDSSLDDWNKFFSKFFRCPTLKTLIVDRTGMRIHTFHNILRVFPNLTKLVLDFTEDGVEIVRQIWTEMTQLKALSIRGYFESMEELELDSLFTGIPTKTLKKIRHVVNGLEKMTVEERRERILKLRTEHCRLPSIGNLTKLKHLELNVVGSGGVNERKESLRSFAGHRIRVRETYLLSDVTAYLAVYTMRHLNYVKVRYSTFTKTFCEILTKETGLECWTFGTEYGKNIIPPFVRHECENRVYKDTE